MGDERKSFSAFVKQKTPEMSRPKPAPTSAGVKAKLVEVLDSLNDTAAVSAQAKALNSGRRAAGQLSTPSLLGTDKPGSSSPWD
jgi:hypothetical protein